MLVRQQITEMKLQATLVSEITDLSFLLKLAKAVNKQSKTKTKYGM